MAVAIGEINTIGDESNIFLSHLQIVAVIFSRGGGGD